MKRGDIYFIRLPNNTGDVQQGYRPAVVIQNNFGNSYSNTTIVACLTSKLKQPLPTHCFIKKGVGGLKANSTVLCEQLITIDKRNLGQYIGTIKNNPVLEKLDQCIRVSLGLEEEYGNHRTYRRN